MAKRRSQGNSLLLELSKLPWWISVGISAFVFIVLKFIIPAMEMQSSMMKGLQSVLPNLAWLLAIVFLIPAAKSFADQMKRRPQKSSAPRKLSIHRKPRTPQEPFSTKPSHRPEVVNMLMDQAAPDETSTHSQSIGKPTEWSEELLGQIEWKRFEELCRAYFEAKGYTAKGTRVGADGGVDIELYKGKADKPAILVQCKAWKSKVGVKPVRELYGVMKASSVPQCVLMATNGFTSDAITFAKGKKYVLASGSSLLGMINQMPEDIQAKLLEVATEGDYTTPTCASCDTKMLLRSGKVSGNNFWGCSNYP
ncbi:MAG: DUF2034 domain-containing protein, partial [Mariprofundaceae bacterium]